MMDAVRSPEVQALLARRERLDARRWRELLWVPGEAAACRRRALAVWRSGTWVAPLWVSRHRPEAVAPAHWLPPGRARSRLGGEQDLLVIDAASVDEGFDPEAFGALAGTLRAGGLLLLLTPETWGACPDADYVRLAAHPWRPERLTARYLRRLARQLEAEGASRWHHGGLTFAPLPAAEAAEPVATDPDCLTTDQAEAVHRLTRLRRRRPLVLTADRGRGKSAALGIACARLLAGGEAKILVTAPRLAAVAPLFERLAALCPRGRRRGGRFHLEGGEVCFLVPDELQARVRAGEAGGAGALLLVDEAAAIPPALLGEWLVHFPRIAFATTVHGYEGSGRGFALRFRARLEAQAPEWREWRLTTPVRWAPGDPLERLVQRLLLLDAEPAPLASVAGEVRLRRVDRDALAVDEPRLASLFGLLVQAHYRTAPSDLRQLLDGPALHLSVLEGEAPLGVLVTADEGGFDAALAEAVARGERRPRGHLMAQSLAAHAGSRAALTHRLRRVVRIAVHPEARRQGLGRRLIETALAQAAEEGCDLLGASFGAEPGLLAFWRRLGFRTLRLGLTRDAATGEHALMVARPVSAAGERLVTALAARFQQSLPGLLAFELSDLAPELAGALLAEGETPWLDAQVWQDVDDVASGHREPALARPALQALARRALTAGMPAEAAALRLLVAWAFLGWRDEALAAWLGVSGRKPVLARLRGAVAELREGLAPGA